jgi:hypothetical protein
MLSLIVGTLLTFFPIASMLFNLVEIPKESLANNLIEKYASYRDYFLGFIPTILSAIGAAIEKAPNILKDILTLYLLGMGSMFFSSRQTAIHDEALFKSAPEKLEDLIRKSVSNFPGSTKEKVEIKWMQVRLSMMSTGFRYVRYFWVALKWPAPLARNLYQYFFARSDRIKENSKRVVSQFLFKLVLPISLSFIALIAARYF